MYLCLMQNFEKLGIRKEFIKGLNELGIQQPTEIQRGNT